MRYVKLGVAIAITACLAPLPHLLYAGELPKETVAFRKKQANIAKSHASRQEFKNNIFRGILKFVPKSGQKTLVKDYYANQAKENKAFKEKMHKRDVEFAKKQSAEIRAKIRKNQVPMTPDPESPEETVTIETD